MSIDLGGFEPILIESIVDALTPKAVRHQALQQHALTALARLQPVFQDLPEADKKNLYNKFFRAYGMAQPAYWRGVFGAGPEPILPLPEGATVTEEGMPPSLLGRLRRRTVYTLPEVRPHTFPDKPLLSEQHETELVKSFKEAGMDEEEIKEALAEKKSGMGRTAAAQTGAMVQKALRWMNQFKLTNPEATDEMALDALKRDRPTLGIPYEMYKNEKELMGTYRKTLTEDIKDRAKARETKAAFDKDKQKFYEQKVKADQDFRDRKFKAEQQNRVNAEKSKTADQLMRYAQTAYRNYLQEFTEQRRQHDQMEVNMAKLYPDYVPARFTGDALKFEDWLLSEGWMFGQRFHEIQSTGGVAPKPGESTPPTQQKPKSLLESMREKYFGGGKK